MALVLDTGVLIAAILTNEPDHDACRSLINDANETLVIPAPVFVELEYLLHKRSTIQTWMQVAEDVASGAYRIFPLDAVALLTAARLQERYRDLRLGLVDAAVFVACESLGETKLATLDRRHFSVLLTQRGRALDLVPDQAPDLVPDQAPRHRSAVDLKRS